MSDKRFPTAALCALACTLLAALIAAIVGSGSSPVACAGTKAPEAAVTGFFDALCNGDMQLADSYVGDYSGLGLNGETSSKLEKALYDELVSSYSYSLQDKPRAQSGSRCYVQTVSFRHLDLDSATANINEVFEKSFREAQTEFAYDDLYNEDGSYSQAVIDSAVDKTVERIFADMDAVTVTENIDVEVQYSGGKWQVVISDRLADAILGGTEVSE